MISYTECLYVHVFNVVLSILLKFRKTESINYDYKLNIFTQLYIFGHQKAMAYV